MFNKLINKLKKTQMFWNILSKFSPLYFFAGYQHERLPDELIIETTNACDISCPVCPTYFAMERKKGLMDFELFRSIIDEFKVVAKKPVISMSFSGEPLLNKNIDRFVKYASENGHKTYISTNATTLSKDLSMRLIKSGLSSIHLCIDGFNKESHEAYRVGSNFERIKKNIEDFMSAVGESNTRRDKLFVTIQTLLTSFSEYEMDEITEWARNIGADEVNFKTLSMGSYTTKLIKEKYSYLLPTQEKFKRKTTGLYRTLCSVPLRQAVVYWNGDLGLCCVDFNNMTKLPNIKERGFIKTFLSKEVLHKRKLGFQKRYDLCKDCSLGNADFMGLNVSTKVE